MWLCASEEEAGGGGGGGEGRGRKSRTKNKNPTQRCGEKTTIQKGPWQAPRQASRQASIFERSLEVKLPTICRDGKAEVGREEKSRSEKIRDGESQKRQDAGARKGREVAIHCVFPCFSNDLLLRRVEK